MVPCSQVILEKMQQASLLQVEQPAVVQAAVERVGATHQQQPGAGAGRHMRMREPCTRMA